MRKCEVRITKPSRSKTRNRYVDMCILLGESGFELVGTNGPSKPNVDLRVLLHDKVMLPRVLPGCFSFAEFSYKKGGGTAQYQGKYNFEATDKYQATVVNHDYPVYEIQ